MNTFLIVIGIWLGAGVPVTVAALSILLRADRDAYYKKFGEFNFDMHDVQTIDGKNRIITIKRKP